MKVLATAILLMLTAAPLTLLAQSTVHGSVVDAQTGSPIAGATVVVAGTANGTLTAPVHSLSRRRTAFRDSV